MQYLNLNEALYEMGIRVFATHDHMKKEFEILKKKFGEEKALDLFNEEAYYYGIQASIERV